MKIEMKERKRNWTLNFEGMPMFTSMNLILEYATAFVLEILIIKL